MDLINFLLSYFLSEKGGENLKPLLELFEKNSFDLKKTLNNMSFETVMPIISEFLGNINKNPQTEKVYGLEPISEIADREIVFSLNKMLAEV